MCNAYWIFISWMYLPCTMKSEVMTLSVWNPTFEFICSSMLFGGCKFCILSIATRAHALCAREIPINEFMSFAHCALNLNL